MVGRERRVGGWEQGGKGFSCGVRRRESRGATFPRWRVEADHSRTRVPLGSPAKRHHRKARVPFSRWSSANPRNKSPVGPSCGQRAAGGEEELQDGATAWIGNQPISFARFGKALAPIALAINWAPRQMPRTDLPDSIVLRTICFSRQSHGKRDTALTLNGPPKTTSRSMAFGFGKSADSKNRVAVVSHPLKSSHYGRCRDLRRGHAEERARARRIPKRSRGKAVDVGVFAEVDEGGDFGDVHAGFGGEFIVNIVEG